MKLDPPGSLAARLGGTGHRAPSVPDAPALVEEEPVAPEPEPELVAVAAVPGELAAEVRALRSEVDSLRQELRASVHELHDGLHEVAAMHPGADHGATVLRDKLAVFRHLVVAR